ncbi:DUF547 domain-containing protein [bacterium]|nr:DUF547 domain-containing protein [bacterium]
MIADSKEIMTISTIFISLLGVLFSAYAENDMRQEFNYDDYAATLKTYMNNQGMVNYKQLKVNREKLDSFVLSVGRLNTESYEKWSEKKKIAFWLNIYNALTLKAIIDNYPIKSSFFKARLYPKNSIRQISGVWDKLKFTVMGRNMTLDDIEHKTLRKNFNEPRIHAALVCAAMGCPPLRNEPYTGDKLDAQLNDQARRFWKNTRKFKIDRNKKIVYLSSIFKWFGEDFVKTYGTDETFDGHSKPERAVLNFISKYLDDRNREYLTTGKYKIKYLDYDWSLNEQ